MKKLLLPSALLFTTSLFAQPAIADSVAIPYEDLADTAAYYYEDKQGYDDFSFDPANLENFEFNGNIYKVYPYVIEAPFVPSVEEEVAAPAPLSKKELRKLKKKEKNYPTEDVMTVDSAKALYDMAYGENWDGEIPPFMYQIPDSVYVLLQKQNDGTRKVRAVFTMQNNFLQGLATYYDESGLVSKQGSFSEGMKHGKWESYIYLKGNLFTSSENYDNGHKDGAFITYSSTGNVAYIEHEGVYANGEKISSRQFALRQNDSVYLYSEMKQEDGVYKYKQYYENGSLFYEAVSE